MAETRTYPTSDDLISSEAYRHGRTLERLKAARIALNQIAFGKKVRNVHGARAIAKLGLELSGEEGRETDA